MIFLETDQATIECDGTIVVKCEIICCNCGSLLAAIGGYGFPSNPQGQCPVCGHFIDDCLN
jgi:hypothetical protein